MLKILVCAVFLLSEINGEEATENSLLKRLVSRIPNSNLSLTKLAERLGDGLKEAVNKMPESNSTLGKLADRVDSGVKKMVDTIRPSADTLHILGERVMDGIRNLAALLPAQKSDKDKEAETDDKKKPFALDIKIPHIFSLQLSRSKGEGGRLGLSVLRPLLDLNISRRRNKDKEEGIDRREEHEKEIADNTEYNKEESNEADSTKEKIKDI